MSSEPYRSASRAGASRSEAPDTKTLASVGTPSGTPGGACARPGRDETPVFLPSEVLAGRFRVVRLLGRGGMGEIYEVEDLELGVRVAIKTLRPRLAAGESALALFRNEIQLARRVTHPNVCRTFDAFRHRRDGDADAGRGVAFLTMELLPGETLSSHLRRRGPLPLERALPLLRQVAAGLDAAHAAGIVHRDLKSGNVLLAGGERGAVVTDFGLAAAVAGASGAAPSTGGTEPYRAPEQAVGREAGPAADLYALGVVALEMLAGLPPAGTPPRRAAAESGLAPEVVAVLCRCLDARPERRPSSALEIHRQLVRAAAAPADRRRRRWRAAAASLAALLPLLWLGGRPGHPGATPPGASAPATAESHLTLMVAAAADVGTSSGCPTCLPVALSELLKAELAPAVVEVLEPVLLYGPVQLAAGAAPDAPRPREWAKLLGADLVVTLEREAGGDDGAGGTGRHRIGVLRDGEREPLFRVVRAALEGGSPSAEAAVLAQDVIGGLRRVLPRGLDPAAAADRRHLMVGTDPVALDLYARGFETFGDMRLPEAAELLGKALDREPEAFRFLLLRAELLRQLSRDGEALEAVRRAQRVAGRLAEDERVEAQAVAARVSYDFAASAERLGELVRRHPERVDWHVLQSRLHLLAGQPEASLQVLDGLVERSPRHRRDPRLRLIRAEASGGAGNPQEQLRQARYAARRAEELGLPHLAVAALGVEYEALRALGRAEEAIPVVDRALARSREHGRRRWTGQVLRWKGNLMADLDRMDEARHLYRQGARLARESGDLENRMWCLNNLGELDSMAGDLEAAEVRFGEALELLRRILRPHAISLVRSHLVEVWARQGRLERVEEQAPELLAAAQSKGDLRVQALSLMLLGQAALDRGDLAAAEHLLERAAVSGEAGHPRLLPRIHALRTGMLLELDRPEAARQAAEEAAAAAEDWSSALPRAWSLAARGGVEAADGRAEEARDTYLRAVEQARAGHDRVLAATLERRLGRMELLLGHADEAERRLVSALEAHRRFGAELEVAHGHRALAELHLALERPLEATAHARAALDRYRSTGAEGAVVPARDLLDRATSGTRLAEALKVEAR